MSKVCVGHAQKSLDTEKMLFGGICQFRRDLRMQENINSIDVRTHPRIREVKKHLLQL